MPMFNQAPPHRRRRRARADGRGSDRLRVIGQEMQFVEIVLDPGEPRSPRRARSSTWIPGSRWRHLRDGSHQHRSKVLRQARGRREARAHRRVAVHDGVRQRCARAPEGRVRGTVPGKIIPIDLRSTAHPAVSEGCVPVRGEGIAVASRGTRRSRRPVRRRGLHPAELEVRASRSSTRRDDRLADLKPARRSPRHGLPRRVRAACQLHIQWVGGFKSALFGRGLFFATLTGPVASGCSRCRSRGSRVGCSRGRRVGLRARRRGSAIGASAWLVSAPDRAVAEHWRRRPAAGRSATSTGVRVVQEQHLAELRWRIACSAVLHARTPPRRPLLGSGCMEDTLSEDTAYPAGRRLRQRSAVHRAGSLSAATRP